MAINKIDAGTPSRPVSVRHWADRYVGIPFVDGGCSLSGCSCWGLVRLVLANECLIDVPPYGELSAAELVKAAKRIPKIAAADPWISVVGRPRSFDVALMTAMAEEDGPNPRTFRVPGHVGIMSSDTQLLHVWIATDAVNMPIDSPYVRSKILGFYRHRLLA